MPKRTASTVRRTQQRGDERSRAQLDAAAALFVEKGFEATSLDDVISRAGGSRTTLYRRFGDKDGLFRAMMEEHCNRIQADMAIVLDSCADPSHEDCERRLTRVGMHIMVTLLDPKTVAILHALASEAKRVPDIAQAFLDAGPGKSISKVSEYLRVHSGHKLMSDQCDAAAEAFFGLVLGPMLLRRLLLPAEAISMSEAEKHVQQAVTLFLGGYLALRKDQ